MALTKKQRAIPPRIVHDERLTELPAHVRLTAALLPFYTDDEGRASATPALIRSHLWPFDPSKTDDVLEEHLLILAEVEHIDLYTHRGRTYLALVDWPAVDRGVPSELPPPPREPVASPSRMTRDTFAVVGREGDGGTGPRFRDEGPRVDASRGLRDSPEPSPFCVAHTPIPSQYPCGPCASARELHALWMRAQIRAAQEELNDQEAQ